MIWNNPITIISIIKIIGGLILMTQAMNKKVTAAAWSKNVLALSGLTAFLGGVFFIFLIYSGDILLSSTIKYLSYYRTLIDGVTIGLLIALFWSGELSLKKWKT